MKLTVKITHKEQGVTVKQYLAEQGYSTSQTKRLKYGGVIAVNDEPVTVRHVLQEGDVLTLETEQRPSSPLVATIPAEILFVDEHLYVAKKPYGVAIHPDRAHKSDTFGNMLAASFGENFRLRIVTRLDKTTSGLVLGALDEVTAEKLNALQQRHEIAKTYIALVEGVLENENGEIDLPLARIDAENKTVVDLECGKPSKTRYGVKKRNENTTLLTVTPLTGRTHQIRAHLAAIGHPIVGDTLYGASPAERIMLHCERLTFTHPYTGEQVVVTSPADFNR
ncbi:MAG: RluA family pseudouridine synthase [Clostridiales bacterium]|nr:RluA family pseudouridine synthase [Clostridiales bacterium]